MLEKLRTVYSREITSEYYGKEVTVAGWIQNTRKKGKISFIVLRDREGEVQLTCLKAELGDAAYDKLTGLPRESVISVRGLVQQSNVAHAGYEILPKEFKVLNEAATPLPLGVVDKVGVDLDTRLNNRFMDLRKPDVEAIFAIRSLLLQGIRDYLSKSGFIEINTPKIVSAGAEGGATLFGINYFGKAAYLAQSPQLFKQSMMATGFDRVFEIAPAYRAEASDTVRHLSEFISLDIEIAFIQNSGDVMSALENLIAQSMEYVKKNGEVYLKELNVVVNVPKVPFRKIPHAECIRMLKEKGKEAPGGDIDTEGEKMLGEMVRQQYGEEFFFITDFPTELKKGTFYAMRKDENPELTGYFDLEFKGQELVSGGQREHRLEKLIAQMKENNLNPENFEFYLKAFQYGMPPHGGFGLGIERFVQKMLDLPNIRETVLFPRDRLRLVP